jgi:hypothetical protein
MQARPWTLAAGTLILALAALPARGDDDVAAGKWPTFHVFSMTGEVMAPAPPPPAAMGPARDYRVLWGDPANREFVGPSENAWDFNKGDVSDLAAMPGGSLPYEVD